jgi:hypothetical protein
VGCAALKVRRDVPPSAARSERFGALLLKRRPWARSGPGAGLMLNRPLTEIAAANCRLASSAIVALALSTGAGNGEAFRDGLSSEEAEIVETDRSGQGIDLPKRDHHPS